MKAIASVLIAVVLLVSGASFAQSGNAWHQVPGFAKDIGLGADGSVWIIGTNPSASPNDFGVHRWKEKIGTEWKVVECKSLSTSLGYLGS